MYILYTLLISSVMLSCVTNSNESNETTSALLATENEGMEDATVLKYKWYLIHGKKQYKEPKFGHLFDNGKYVCKLDNLI